MEGRVIKVELDDADVNLDATLTTLIRRLTLSQPHVGALQDWLARRGKVEKDYADKLDTLATMLPECNDGSTFAEGWTAFSVASEQYVKIARRRGTALCCLHEMLAEFAAKQADERRRTSADLYTVKSEHCRMSTQVTKAQGEYSVAKDAADSAADVLLDVKRDSLKLKEIEKAQKVNLRASRVHQECSDRFTETASRLRNTEMVAENKTGMTNKMLDKMEFERYTTLRRILWLCANVDSVATVDVDNLQEIVRQALTHNDVEGDVILARTNFPAETRTTPATKAKKGRRISVFDQFLRTARTQSPRPISRSPSTLTATNTGNQSKSPRHPSPSVSPNAIKKVSYVSHHSSGSIGSNRSSNLPPSYDLQSSMYRNTPTERSPAHTPPTSRKLNVNLRVDTSATAATPGSQSASSSNNRGQSASSNHNHDQSATAKPGGGIFSRRPAVRQRPLTSLGLMVEARRTTDSDDTIVGVDVIGPPVPPHQSPSPKRQPAKKVRQKVTIPSPNDYDVVATDDVEINVETQLTPPPMSGTHHLTWPSRATSVPSSIAENREGEDETGDGKEEKNEEVDPDLE